VRPAIAPTTCTLAAPAASGSRWGSQPVIVQVRPAIAPTTCTLAAPAASGSRWGSQPVIVQVRPAIAPTTCTLAAPAARRADTAVSFPALSPRSPEGLPNPTGTYCAFNAASQCLVATLTSALSCDADSPLALFLNCLMTGKDVLLLHSAAFQWCSKAFHMDPMAQNCALEFLTGMLFLSELKLRFSCEVRVNGLLSL
uniref:SPARK domain-containing protein n=1 Tax=Macrostomum lignano TaxID=282301 RepID=A0A1I8HZW9_9PLAT